MIKPLAAAALAAAVQLAAPSAHATAPVYPGHYTLDSTVAGSVAAESGPYGTPDNWSLWTFDAPFMAVVTLTITPSSPDLDLYAAVFYGTESSLAHYTDMVFNGGLSSTLVVSGDGPDPYLPAGVGQPVVLRFTNTYGSGPFVLAISDYTDGIGAGQLHYTIGAVPEPATWALVLTSLMTVGALRRRR